jgi:hypothetical protein
MQASRAAWRHPAAAAHSEGAFSDDDQLDRVAAVLQASSNVADHVLTATRR